MNTALFLIRILFIICVIWFLYENQKYQDKLRNEIKNKKKLETNDSWDTDLSNPRNPDYKIDIY
jgi:hypothetical protein